ncbi:uncharacterized protein [Eurosta solidaginis]|uniref:uncharacterized protein isoform X3 n=1 Tax=Eurosta solidaginis TaxID=178769 RepID=UPI0035314707
MKNEQKDKIHASFYKSSREILFTEYSLLQFNDLIIYYKRYVLKKAKMPLFNTTINSNMSSQNNAKPLKMSFATSGDFTATAHAHAQPSVVKVSKTSNTERQTSPRKWTSHEPNDARYFDESKDIGSEPKNYGTAVGKFGVKCSIFIEAGNQSSPTTTLAPPTRTLTTTPNCTPTLLWNRIYGGSSKEGGRHDVVVRNG